MTHEGNNGFYVIKNLWWQTEKTGDKYDDMAADVWMLSKNLDSKSKQYLDKYNNTVQECCWAGNDTEKSFIDNIFVNYN